MRQSSWPKLMAEAVRSIAPSGTIRQDLAGCILAGMVAKSTVDGSGVWQGSPGLLPVGTKLLSVAAEC